MITAVSADGPSCWLCAKLKENAVPMSVRAKMLMARRMRSMTGIASGKCHSTNSRDPKMLLSRMRYFEGLSAGLTEQSANVRMELGNPAKERQSFVKGDR